MNAYVVHQGQSSTDSEDSIMTQIPSLSLATDSSGEDVGSGLFASLAAAEWGRLAIRQHGSQDGPCADAAPLAELRTALLAVTLERDSLVNGACDLNHSVVVLSGELADMSRTCESLMKTLSHDLPAPLRGIIGFSRLCLEEEASSLTPQAREYLQRVLDAGSHMARMMAAVNRFLELGRVQLHPERIHLGGMALSLIEEMRIRDPSRQIEFAMSASADASCFGDRSLLRTLLEIVLGNAWKFTARRPDARIDVSMVECSSGQTWQVRDNGTGFDMKHATRLFTLFKRMHEDDDFPGLGIGLALAQQIVRRHGGWIKIEAVLGQGTVLSITLPSLSPEVPANL
jgi:signal transduction histidine kinase